jgi:hypothetical protein
MDEADLIDELTSLAAEQRESVKGGNYSAMQDMMKCMQNLSFRIQAQENQRSKIADTVAKELGCKPRLSDLSGAFPDEDRAFFLGVGERLGHSIFSLKAEMAILSGLVEQNERYGAMLLSEWRRLDAGFMRSGGLDFRG